MVDIITSQCFAFVDGEGGAIVEVRKGVVQLGGKVYDPSKCAESKFTVVSSFMHHVTWADHWLVGILTQVINLIVGTVCGAHITACLFSYFARLDDDTFYSQSWVLEYGLMDANWFSEYIAALYWVCAVLYSISKHAWISFVHCPSIYCQAFSTLCTVGYGDISPVSNAEKIFAMFAM